MSDIQIQTIGQQQSVWGECPIWWEGALYYVDTNGGQIIRFDPESGAEKVWDMGERVGTVVPTTAGDFLYAGDLGITRWNPETGEKVVLADPEPEKRGDNRFNDGKCDPSGRFWAGTISTVKKTGDAKLYRLDQAGALQAMIPAVTNSNGIRWSADKTKMYYIDTPTHAVVTYDYDDATGALSDPKKVIDTEAHGYTTSPDGMDIDADGNLWVAFCHGGCVVCFDPRTGAKIRELKFPCIETTACTFGGPNLDRLFVTTGVKSGLDEPKAGRLFVVDGLGVQGVPATAYAG